MCLAFCDLFTQSVVAVHPVFVLEVVNGDHDARLGRKVKALVLADPVHDRGQLLVQFIGLRQAVTDIAKLAFMSVAILAGEPVPVVELLRLAKIEDRPEIDRPVDDGRSAQSQKERRSFSHLDNRLSALRLGVLDVMAFVTYQHLCFEAGGREPVSL